MVGKCVKLILILALVVAVAFGVSFLPFSLSDKFKEVAEKVTSKIRDLANMGQTTTSGVQLDFSKRENYKFGEFNVVLERTENEPKSGFVKFIHKGENDFVLPVNKFLNGETELTGLETGDFDFAAAFFKGNLPHLVMIELRKHGEKAENAGDKAATEEEELDEEDALSWFYVPGENNAWVKLEAGVDRARKAEEVLARLIEEAEAKAPAVPATPAARKGTKKAAVAAKAPAPAKKAAKATAPKAKVVKVVEPEEDDGEELEFDEEEEESEEEEGEEEEVEGEEEEEEVEVEVLPPKPTKAAAKKTAARPAQMKTKAAKKPAATEAKSEFEETPEEFSAGGNLRGQGADSSLGSTVDHGVAA